MKKMCAKNLAVLTKCLNYDIIIINLTKRGFNMYIADYVSALDTYFSPREMAFISKNSDAYLECVEQYKEVDIEILITRMIELGNRKIRFKYEKLEYLAIYECLLNHEKLFPTNEQIEKRYEEQLNKALNEGYETYGVKNTNSQILPPISVYTQEDVEQDDEAENSQTSEEDKKSLKIKLRARDLIFKLAMVEQRAKIVAQQVSLSVDERVNRFVNDDKYEVMIENKHLQPSKYEFDGMYK